VRIHLLVRISEVDIVEHKNMHDDHEGLLVDNYELD
jgi:hypothetical protein